MRLVRLQSYKGNLKYIPIKLRQKVNAQTILPI